jgi:hypothetical protein
MKGVDSMKDMLPVKVKFANLYLNQILISDGKVTTTDMFSVVTKDMLDTGKLVLIDVEELLALTRGDTFVEFVKLKEVA